MKNKHNQFVLGCGVIGAVLALSGIVSNGQTFAVEIAPGELAVTSAEVLDVDVQQATDLATKVRQLEATSDYQKMAEVLRTFWCARYDEQDLENHHDCSRKTDVADLRRALLEVVPQDKYDDVARIETMNWQTLQQIIWWVDEWEDVYQVVQSVRHGNEDLLGEGNLSHFENSLALLQGDTALGKIARLNTKFPNNNPWMALILAVYRAEGDSGSYAYYMLSDALVYFVGNTSGLTLAQKLTVARDLSEYAQAKVLFDTLNSVCQRVGDGYDWFNSTCWSTVKQVGYTEEELAEKYEKLELYARMLYPDILEGLDNYHLVLAELPEMTEEVPSVPNTGDCGDNGEKGLMIAPQVVLVGAVVVIFGSGVILKLYWSRIKRIMKR